MSVNYRKVVNDLTDVIKELNVGFAPCGAAAPAAPSEETRRADAVGVLKTLLHVLEQGGAGAAGAGDAAAAEHSASASEMPDFGKLEHCPDFDERHTLLDGRTKAVAYPHKGYNCHKEGQFDKT